MERIAVHPMLPPHIFDTVPSSLHILYPERGWWWSTSNEKAHTVFDAPPITCDRITLSMVNARDRIYA